MTDTLEFSPRRRSAVAMSQPNNGADRDAATLLEGLADLPEAKRMAAHGRLVEELERVIRERRASVGRSEALLGAVLKALRDGGSVEH